MQPCIIPQCLCMHNITANVYTPLFGHLCSCQLSTSPEAKQHCCYIIIYSLPLWYLVVSCTWERDTVGTQNALNNFVRFGGGAQAAVFGGVYNSDFCFWQRILQSTELQLHHGRKIIHLCAVSAMPAPSYSSLLACRRCRDGMQAHR